MSTACTFLPPTVDSMISTNSSHCSNSSSSGSSTRSKVAVNSTAGTDLMSIDAPSSSFASFTSHFTVRSCPESVTFPGDTTPARMMELKSSGLSKGVGFASATGRDPSPELRDVPFHELEEHLLEAPDRVLGVLDALENELRAREVRAAARGLRARALLLRRRRPSRAFERGLRRLDHGLDRRPHVAGALVDAARHPLRGRHADRGEDLRRRVDLQEVLRGVDRPADGAGHRRHDRSRAARDAGDQALDELRAHVREREALEEADDRVPHRVERIERADGRAPDVLAELDDLADGVDDRHIGRDERHDDGGRERRGDAYDDADDGGDRFDTRPYGLEVSDPLLEGAPERLDGREPLQGEDLELDEGALHLRHERRDAVEDRLEQVAEDFPDGDARSLRRVEERDELAEPSEQAVGVQPEGPDQIVVEARREARERVRLLLEVGAVFQLRRLHGRV